MGGYGLNPNGTNGASAPPQQPSWWDTYVQKAQNLHPLSSLLGQGGSQLEQRPINLLHGDGFRTDAQVYPPLPLPTATRPTSRTFVPGDGAGSGIRQSQPQVAPLQNPQAPGAGQGGVRGYAHALADNLGVASIAHQVAHPIQAMSEMQQQAAADQHPFQTALKRATIDNPMLGVPELRGLAGTAKNSLMEVGQAFNDLGITPYGYQAPQYGANYFGAGVHAVRAIPVLGAGLQKGTEYASQNGMGDPGNSYLQNVGKVWSSPKAMGTLTGMALQAAPVAAERLQAAGWDGPLNVIGNAVSRPLGAARGVILKPLEVSGPAKVGNSGFEPVRQYTPARNLGVGLPPDNVSSISGGAPVSLSPTAPDLLKANYTSEQIQNVLRNSDLRYLTSQKSISAPRVNQYIDKLRAGEEAPAVHVDQDLLVDGSHRVAAGEMEGKPPREQRWSSSKGIPTKPFKEIYVDPEDW